MTYKIVVTDTYSLEYEKILKYLTSILKEKSAAKNLNDEIDHIVGLISTNPNLFGLSINNELKKRKYHLVTVANYLILYKVQDDKVFISHIFHQTQDYANLV